MHIFIQSSDLFRILKFIEFNVAFKIDSFNFVYHLIRENIRFIKLSHRFVFLSRVQ